MTANAIGNVLGILRLLRAGEYGASVSSHVTNWCGGSEDDPISSAKVAAYVLENVASAEAQIEMSRLNIEAKQGLLQTTAALKHAFTYANLNSSVQSYFPTLDTSISGFAILVSASGLEEGLPDEEAIASLIADIDSTLLTLDEVDVHPLVREVAKRHIAVLVTMLKNAQALGVDAAMAAYFELVIHLRRADQTKPDDANGVDPSFWEKLKEWGGRLNTISELADKGGSLLAYGDKVLPLLKHILPN